LHVSVLTAEYQAEDNIKYIESLQQALDAATKEMQETKEQLIELHAYIGRLRQHLDQANMEKGITKGELDQVCYSCTFFYLSKP